MCSLPQESLPAGWRGELVLTLRSVHPSHKNWLYRRAVPLLSLCAIARNAHYPERFTLSGANAPAGLYRLRGTFL